MISGREIEQLADELQDEPVLFLEQSILAPIGNRYDRFRAAQGKTASVSFPVIVVDSGHEFTSGSYPGGDYASAYRSLVEAELSREPRAEVDAYARRAGDTLVVYATITNRSGSRLSSATNGATVHALVWEEKHVGVTGRYVRAAPSTPVATSLAPGARASFTLTPPPLRNVDWAKLHAVAVIDYRPGGAKGRYDMLQASIARPAAITSSPKTIAFDILPSAPGAPSAELLLRGPYVAKWTASSNVPWLTVNPSSGTLPARANVRVAAKDLPVGTHEAVITIRGAGADGLSLATTVPVAVNYMNEMNR